MVFLLALSSTRSSNNARRASNEECTPLVIGRGSQPGIKIPSPQQPCKNRGAAEGPDLATEAKDDKDGDAAAATAAGRPVLYVNPESHRRTMPGISRMSGPQRRTIGARPNIPVPEQPPPPDLGRY